MSLEFETGRIRKFGEQRGFGFITPDAGIGADLFFHVRESNIAEPAAHMRVEFVRRIDPRTGRDCAQLVRQLNFPQASKEK